MNAATAMAPEPGWEVEELAGLAGFDRLRPEWEQMWAEGGAGAQPFFHPGWIRAHAAAMEPRARLWTLAARRRGRLQAVLPLLRERAWFRGLPVRRLRAVAGRFSVRFDATAAAGEDGAAAVRALALYLSRRRGWGVLEMRDVPAGGAATLLVQELAQLGHPTGKWLALESPYIDLAGAPGAPPLPPGFASTSKKFRAQMEQGRRQLEASGASLRLSRLRWSAPAELQAHLQAFYAFEHAGWKGRNRSSILARPGGREYFDQIAAAMADCGALVLHQLDAGEQRLAMSMGLWHAGVFYVLKWAYDESFARVGPGHLLIAAMLQELTDASAPALHRFDITGANEAYKEKWTKTRTEHHYWYAFGQGGMGRVLHQLKFRWTPQLQRWLGRTP